MNFVPMPDARSRKPGILSRIQTPVSDYLIPGIQPETRDPMPEAFF
jgi:hypothetical protein